MEKTIRDAQAAVMVHLIVMAGDSGPDFQRGYVDGTLAGIAAHLVKTFGPQSAYNCFQRLADECARSLVDESRA